MTTNELIEKAEYCNMMAKLKLEQASITDKPERRKDYMEAVKSYSDIADNYIKLAELSMK